MYFQLLVSLLCVDISLVSGNGFKSWEGSLLGSFQAFQSQQTSYPTPEPDIYKVIWDVGHLVLGRVNHLPHVLEDTEGCFRNSSSGSLGEWVPVDWRPANVKPIYQKGWEEDPGNWSPIRLPLVPEELMEQIILSDITQQYRTTGGSDTMGS
ncbi:hypothetical protein WISP_08377 [Willisornis vidua]|uniref:Uncharacterized protein n=1 Tax=Willisornis vidua TaxID=1566151 RepID=A0ABQ9DS86_9PASS|nr:hypothetical protein WISP_08377 [Willisornis vidua]